MSVMQKQISLDETLAKDIVNAVVSSMSHTFNVDVKPGNTEYGEGMVSLGGDISGIIGLVQDQLDGTLILCMPFETLREILPHVLGKTVEITHEMATDAVGELTNMIFGQVKRELNLRSHQIKLGVPCVVSGKGHFVCQFYRGRNMIVPFHLDGKMFQVYVGLNDSVAEGPRR
ncbi:MAG: chemotaxis protein CheX [Alphaproteobacteria bacterium]|nr:chemotaxis protein CheX [Alphaproteobacteria bacterium]